MTPMMAKLKKTVQKSWQENSLNSLTKLLLVRYESKRIATLAFIQPSYLVKLTLQGRTNQQGRTENVGQGRTNQQGRTENLAQGRTNQQDRADNLAQSRTSQQVFRRKR